MIDLTRREIALCRLVLIFLKTGSDGRVNATYTG